jgi:hypothetical protein
MQTKKEAQKEIVSQIKGLTVVEFATADMPADIKERTPAISAEHGG